MQGCQVLETCAMAGCRGKGTLNPDNTHAPAPSAALGLRPNPATGLLATVFITAVLDLQGQLDLAASMYEACLPGSRQCADAAILFSPVGSFIDFRIQPEGAAVLEYVSQGEKVRVCLTPSLRSGRSQHTVIRGQLGPKRGILLCVFHTLLAIFMPVFFSELSLVSLFL